MVPPNLIIGHAPQKFPACAAATSCINAACASLKHTLKDYTMAFHKMQVIFVAIFFLFFGYYDKIQ